MSEEEDTRMAQANMYPVKKDTWGDWIRDNKLVVFIIIVIIIGGIWWWWSGRGAEGESTATASESGKFTVTKMRGGNFY